MTQQSYAAVGQLGQLLAQEASSLLPRPPAGALGPLLRARSRGISPADTVTLAARRRRRRSASAPGARAVYVFFATWDRRDHRPRRTSLDALDRLQPARPSAGLPALTAVDEGKRRAVAGALAGLPRHAPAPAALPCRDRPQRAGRRRLRGAGRALVRARHRKRPASSGTGRSSTLGWPSTSTLIARVEQALAARRPRRPPAPAPRRRSSPAHRPRSPRCTGRPASCSDHEPQLVARIRALRGYPIVINAWASWCAPVPLRVRPVRRGLTHATAARSRSSAPTPTTPPATRARSSPSIRSATPATRPPPPRSA